MKVLFVSAEVAPYSKTGGLGDVASALPGALERMGHELTVVSPLYRRVSDGGHRLHDVYPEIPIPVIGARFDAILADDGRNWFVDYPPYFGREGIYRNDGDEHSRFLLLTHAALELCHRRGWSPDIVHVNDWHTGFMPLFLRGIYGSDPLFARAQSVFTIHNLGYQGVFGSHIVDDLALGSSRYLLHQEHLRAGRVSFMEHALIYSDAITTVSPTYAYEIQTPEHGFGLDAMLRHRSRDVFGILNGIDPEVWNPSSDPYLPSPYSASELEGKHANKAALLARARIDPDQGFLTVGIVTRLSAQKGIEIALRPLARRLDAGHIRLVVLGSGERRYEAAFGWLAAAFPGRAHFQNGYDESMAHLIEGGADVFLMPSLYEPSGLNQMYSLAYGTPPIVRRTGGLADSVTHYDPARGEGTGFVFDHYSEEGVGWALDQALTLFQNKAQWQILQRNGMAEDNSWERRALEYDRIYRRVTGEEQP
ncbi:MAG: glycogen synthase [Actinobacteria bacterium]|nr:glycogen synthase [Actinomycetota bacterium]